jgi:hypothetical protein
MRRILSVILALSIVTACGAGMVSATVSSDKEQYGGATRADQYISNITYSVTSSKYSANVTLMGFYSGSIYLELQKKNSNNGWDYVDSVYTTFTNKMTPNASESRYISPSTYRLKIQVTIGTTTTRYSGEFNI